MVGGGLNSTVRRFQEEGRDISRIKGGKRGRWVDQKRPNLAGTGDRDSRLPGQITRQGPGIQDGLGVLRRFEVLAWVLSLATQTITPGGSGAALETHRRGAGRNRGFDPSNEGANAQTAWQKKRQDRKGNQIPGEAIQTDPPFHTHLGENNGCHDWGQSDQSYTFPVGIS